MIGDILQPTHLLFILVIALIVLGPKRLPEVGKSLGKGLRDFRVALSSNEEAEHLREGLRETREHLQGAHESLHEPITMQPESEQPPPEQSPLFEQSRAVAPHPVDGEQPQPMAPHPAPANGEVHEPGEVATPAQAPPIETQAMPSAEPATEPTDPTAPAEAPTSVQNAVDPTAPTEATAPPADPTAPAQQPAAPAQEPAERPS